jgi:predicted DNA-binding transcriptional regulator YafY
MPRNDQFARQWHVLRRLESRRGVTLQELAAGLPSDVPKHIRTLRRDLEALETAGYPLLTERVDGQTRWRLADGSRARSCAMLNSTAICWASRCHGPSTRWN